MTATVSFVPVGPTMMMLPMSPLARPPHLSPAPSCGARKRSVAAAGMASPACNTPRKRQRRLFPSSSPSQSPVSATDSNPPLKPRRRVHFQCATNSSNHNSNSVHRVVHTFDRVPSDATPRVWWSRHELLQIRHRETTVLQVHRQCSSYQHQLLRLLAAACGHHHHHGSYASLQRDVLQAANCSARGLERQVVACIRQREKLVRRNVLQSQYALQHYRHKTRGDVASPQLQASMLSEHARNLSRPARHWARILAQGDAHWAAAYQREQC